MPDDESIEDLPAHVFASEEVLDRYGGYEPIVNWTLWDLIKLRDALDVEIRSRCDEE